MKILAKLQGSMKSIIVIVASTFVLFVSTGVNADLAIFDFVDKVLTQTEKRNLNTQNELIDSSRSRSPREAPEPRFEVRVSLDQAVSMVRRSTGGRVIKANTSWSNGRPVHSIRVLLENNRVRTIRIDAVSGRRI